MSVASVKNVQNEKAVGLPVWCIECGRRREIKEESATREDARGKTVNKNAREKIGNVEALNRRRVAAFLELYFLAMVNIENAHRYGYQTRASAKMLNKALTTRVIP